MTDFLFGGIEARRVGGHSCAPTSQIKAAEAAARQDAAAGRREPRPYEEERVTR
jgi:hypothetical protein